MDYPDKSVEAFSARLKKILKKMMALIRPLLIPQFVYVILWELTGRIKKHLTDISASIVCNTIGFDCH